MEELADGENGEVSSGDDEVVAHITTQGLWIPTQDRDRQPSSMGGEGTQRAHPIRRAFGSEGYREVSHCPLGIWLLVGRSCPSGYLHIHVHIGITK